MDQICAACRQPINVTDAKVAIHDEAYHARCWERLQAKQPKSGRRA